LKIAQNVSLCHSANAGKALDLNKVCGPAITAFKPSSLLTLYTMIISFVAAWILPFTGAVIDYTRHRLLMGRITAGLFTILLFPLMFLSKDNYILILICHGCSVFVGWFATTLHFAYLPELTPDEMKLTNWTKCFTIWSYTAMALYLGGCMGGVIGFKRTSDGLFISRFGMAVMFGVNFIFQNFAWWFLFGKRESFHKLPEGSNLFTVGFQQLFKTGSLIVKKYRSLKFFYLYISLSNSGWQAFGIFLVTYLSDYLRFEVLESVIAICCSLAGSIPGAVASAYLAKRFDPIQSARINLILCMICVALMVSILNGPDQQVRTYIFCTFIGFNGGWKITMDRLLSAAIIPEGQDTEMMGFFLFADQCLLWLPLLVYTLMNEAGISPRINVAIVDVYLGIALIFLNMTGNYATARNEVKRGSVYMEKGQIDSAVVKVDAEAASNSVEGENDVLIEDNENPQTAQAKQAIFVEPIFVEAILVEAEA